MSIKKYKLIKEYPNSPKLGSVIIDTSPSNGAKDCWFSENWCKPGVKAFILPRSTNPENHPEFWELVKEKEWEVLELLNTDFSPIYVGKTTQGWYLHDGFVNKFRNEDWAMKHGYKIKSVKRLSDNTIFSIGDKVINPKLKSNAWFIITEFKLDCEGEHMLAFGGGGAIGIHKIEKYKEPIIITEDGVPVYENDEVHWVVNNQDGNGYEYMYKIEFCSLHKRLDFKEIYRIFSTKEAADKFVLDNTKKPILTTEDGVDLFQGDDFWHVDPWFNVGKGSLKDTKPSFFPLDGYHNFSTEQAAKDWIDMNKPQFSKKDIIEACTKFGYS